MHLRGQICAVLSLVILNAVLQVHSESVKSYMKRRARFLAKENTFRFGAEVELNEDEKIINDRIIELKTKKIETGIKTAYYPPGRNFMLVKDEFDEDSLFNIVRRMPKGGVLHSHVSANIDPSWLVKNATYHPDCYMCIKIASGGLKFTFSLDTPEPRDGCTEWQKVNDAREAHGSVEEFDEMLRLNMTILSKDPEREYPDINAVWARADNTWPALGDLAFFKPIFPHFLKEVMRQFLEDGVQYFETRISVTKIYDYEQEYGPEYTMETMKEIIDEFVAENPAFIGIKLILHKSKRASKEKVGKTVVAGVEYMKKYPEMMGGFDLVSQEDAMPPLLHFIDELLLPSQMDPPFDLPYFFHAGETNWEGTRIDRNLVDALLLDTKRIGHGNAIVKHPLVLKRVKKKGIPIELNPISNQVLMLVDDLRNHPCTFLMAENFTVIVSSDDPGLWGALPLSDDMYEMLMNCIPEDQGLDVMKRLAVDSLRYSVMTDEQKEVAYAKWQDAYDKFVAEEAERIRNLDESKRK